jgi:hypothetical protein
MYAMRILDVGLGMYSWSLAPDVTRSLLQDFAFIKIEETSKSALPLFRFSTCPKSQGFAAFGLVATAPGSDSERFERLILQNPAVG